MSTGLRLPAMAGLAVTMLLAACASDGRSPVSSLAAMLPGGAASGTGQTPAPASGPPPAPTRSGAGTAPTLAGESSLRLGNKQVEIAATELDPKCTTLVAPYDLTDNVGELSDMASGMAAEIAADAAGARLGSALGSLLGQPDPASAGKGMTNAQARHTISLNVRRAALRMNWLPMSLERMYGQHQIQQMEERLLDPDEPLGRKLYPEARRQLDQVLAAVGQPHAYTFTVRVRSDAGENAMALPGGYIVVDKALVSDPKLRDKALFALSHEVAHVLQRHETRALQARIIDTLSLRKGLPDLLKTMREAHKEPKAVLTLVVGGKLLFEKHYADQELQSDACAVRLLDANLKDNRRLRGVLQAFIGGLPKTAAPAAKPAQGVDALADMVELVTRPIDRHPSPQARLDNLRTMLAEVEKRTAGDAPAAGRPGRIRPEAAAATTTGGGR